MRKKMFGIWGWVGFYGYEGLTSRWTRGEGRKRQGPTSMGHTPYLASGWGLWISPVSSLQESSSLFPFWRWGNRGQKRWRHLPKVSDRKQGLNPDPSNRRVSAFLPLVGFLSRGSGGSTVSTLGEGGGVHCPNILRCWDAQLGPLFFPCPLKGCLLSCCPSGGKDLTFRGLYQMNDKCLLILPS